MKKFLLSYNVLDDSGEYFDSYESALASVEENYHFLFRRGKFNYYAVGDVSFNLGLEMFIHVFCIVEVE